MREPTRINSAVEHLLAALAEFFEPLFWQAHETAQEAMLADACFCVTPLMNSVPADQRGVASGMRATFQNAATLVSLGAFFSIIIIALAATLSTTLFSGLTQAGVPGQVATTT